MKRLCAYKSRLLSSENTFDKMASTVQLAVFALLVTLTVASPVSNISRATVTTQCPFPGIFCLDCNTLALCVENNGKFLEYTMKQCDPEKPCSSSLKACSEKNSFCINPGITSSTFECVQEGLFPDPYDCNKYHQCGDSSLGLYPPSKTYMCEMDFAFNPTTGKCDLPVSDEQCGEESYPVPKCDPDASMPVSMGALPLDAHYYWICEGERIHILKCPEGKIFKEFTCVWEGEEPVEEPSEETPEESEEPPSGVFQCSGNGKEPDPQSCTRFYDCSDQKKPIRFACPWPQYFHQRKERCVLGFCPY